jgi:hypothetical protein
MNADNSAKSKGGEKAGRQGPKSIKNVQQFLQKISHCKNERHKPRLPGAFFEEK